MAGNHGVPGSSPGPATLNYLQNIGKSKRLESSGLTATYQHQRLFNPTTSQTTTRRWLYRRPGNWRCVDVRELIGRGAPERSIRPSTLPRADRLNHHKACDHVLYSTFGAQKNGSRGFMVFALSRGARTPSPWSPAATARLLGTTRTPKHRSLWRLPARG